MIHKKNKLIKKNHPWDIRDKHPSQTHTWDESVPTTLYLNLLHVLIVKTLTGNIYIWPIFTSINLLMVKQ